MSCAESRVPMGIFAAAACTLLAALPVASAAQPAAKLPLIGFLQPLANCEGADVTIKKALQSLGWVDRKTVTFVCRHNDGSHCSTGCPRSASSRRWRKRAA